jgi:uncharacterized membrane protein
MNKMAITEYLVARIKERSTWIGAIGLLSVIGVTFSPEQTNAIATAGVAVAGVLGVVTRG